jgi:VCBS repeat protein
MSVLRHRAIGLTKHPGGLMKMMILTRAGAVSFAARARRQSPASIVARAIASAAFIGALICVPGPVAAQFTQQGPKLVGSGNSGAESPLTNGQGRSVAVSADGNTAIIGGPSDNGNMGAAWVFTRSNGVWTQQGTKLIGAGATNPALQGNSVALSADGNTAIIGGPDDDSSLGAVWVFTRSNGVWTQQGDKLVGTGAAPGPVNQGFSVALSADGNTAIIGGPFDNPFIGAAWVFTRSNGAWVQQGDKLVGTGAAPGPVYQGFSVAVSADGNTAIVGGYQDNSNVGAAWVFARSNGVWTQQGNKLVGTGAVGPISAGQGQSVALSADGNTAIIGGPGDNTAFGAAWVFTRSNGVWTQQGSKVVGTGVVGIPTQGISVSLSADGNTALMGGWTDNFGTGAAWVFTRSNGVWTQLGNKLVGTGAVDLADQGLSVALSADGLSTAIIGGMRDNNNIGAAWVFTALPKSRTNTHDLNGDGMSDIAWRDTSGNTAVWEMNGAAILNQNSSFVANVPAQWAIVGQRDFDGNGYADLLWHDTSGNVAIWEMAGTTVLNQNSSFVVNVATSWSIVGTGDFNGDGLADILWRDTSGNVAIWEMNGTTILNLANVPGQWSVAGTGDFSGDGKADILWRDTSGDVAIWEMNGTSILNQNSSFVANVPRQWSIKGTGDFNADGMSDILWQDTSGNVAIWEMNGTSILNANSSFVANVPSPWSIQLTGDFNGDGMSDILWQDTLGNTITWFMNGTVGTAGAVGNIPTNWVVQSVNAE